MKKDIFFFSILFLFLCVLPTKAGIVESGHNMLRQQASDKFSEESKSGVCSFCHVPHSSTGLTMWIADPSDYSPVWGEVGRICGSCHDEPAGKAGTPIMSESIFRENKFFINHPLIDDNSDVYDTGHTGNVTNNENENNGGTRQWMSGWSATDREHTSPSDPLHRVTIECSSCHNVHSVTKGIKFNVAATPSQLNGTGASGEFLRAKAFDSTGELGNKDTYNEVTGQGRKQIFCEYCHIGRATSATGPWNTTYVDGKPFSTHPVGRGDVYLEDGTYKPKYKSFNDTTVRRIYDYDSSGWESSIVISPKLRATGFMQNYANQFESGGHLGGPYGIGYDTGIGYEKRGIVICQTCHKVHSRGTGDSDKDKIYSDFTGQSHDGVQLSGNMFDSTIPDLLVIPNNGKSGYNKLCEACHSYRPFLQIRADNPGTGDSERSQKGHPLKHSGYLKGTPYEGSYKFNADGTPSADWSIAYDLCSTGVAIDIPLTWPTGGKNQPVCLSCHDVHGGQAGTKLLRKSLTGNDLICDDCHKKPLRKLGISHPIEEVLINTDGASWPDQVNLTVFGPPFIKKDGTIGPRMKLYSKFPEKYGASNNSSIKYDTSQTTAHVTVKCDTCHDWSNGMIHYYAGKRRDVILETGRNNNGHTHNRKTEDPNHNSELCVSCHTGDPYDQNKDTGNYDYGKNGIRNKFLLKSDSTNTNIEGANPAPWIREYPVSINPLEVSRLSRMGSHASGLPIDHKYDSTDAKSHRNFVYYKVWSSTSVFTGTNFSNFIKTSDKKRSKWGQEFDVLTNDVDRENNKGVAVIICQSCHIPHWASEGLVEYNTAAVGKEPTPNSAILLADQAESFMCRTCHFPPRSHPLSKPSESKYESRWQELHAGSKYESMDYVGKTRTSILLTIDEEAKLPKKNRMSFMVGDILRDSTKLDIFGVKWAVNIDHGPVPPANYPKKGGSMKNQDYTALPGMPIDTTKHDRLLVCDSCHAPHAANTGMGTYILEANYDSIPGRPASAIPNAGDYTKGLFGGAKPSITDQDPTCILCHIKE